MRFLFILYIFTRFINILAITPEPTNIWRYLDQIFRSRYKGLDYTVVFKMKSKINTSGDDSYCLGSIVIVDEKQYLITSTGCLRRNGTNLSTKYYAVKFLVYDQSYQIVAQGNINLNKKSGISLNAILLVELKEVNETQSLVNNNYIDLTEQLHGTLIEDAFSTLKVNLGKQNQEYLADRYVANMTEYYRDIRAKYKKPSPLLVNTIVFKTYYKINSSLEEEKTSESKIIGVYSPNKLILTKTGEDIDRQMLKISQDVVVRDLGAVLISCILNVIPEKDYDQLPIDGCRLIGILTGPKGKNGSPYFNYLTNNVFVLKQDATELTVFQ